MSQSQCIVNAIPTRPHWYVLRFPFNRALSDLLKQIPGVRWVADRKTWEAPLHALGTISDVVQSENFGILQVAPLTNPDHASPYVPPLDSLMQPMREYQADAVKRCLVSGGYLISFDVRLGKAQPLYAKVLTPTGWTAIGQLRIGDFVIDPDTGQAVKVKGVFERGIRQVFDVQMNDGSKTQCCNEHLWYATHIVRRTRHQEGELLSTKELLKRGLQFAGNKQNKWYLPFTEPVHFQRNEDLPLDPYVLGALLGNGFLDDSVCLTTADKFISQKVRGLLPRDVTLNQKGQKTNEFRIVGTVHGTNSVLNVIRALGLCGAHAADKFIPNRYLYASVKDRRALLAGLLDTDGDSATKAVKFIALYSTASPMLRDGVISLVRSLGGFATYGTKEKPKYTYRGQVRYGQTSYRVSIRMIDTPFTLPRKLKHWLPNRMARSIESITPAAVVETRCISVESKRGLYITDDYIVTHNTPVGSIAAASALANGTINTVLVLYPNSVRHEWERQLPMWSHGLKLTPLEGKTPLSPVEARTLKAAPYLVLGCHYEILGDRGECITEILRARGKFTIVADECHFVKNRKAKRTAVALSLAREPGCIFRWGFTGTPMRNTPRDMWAIFDFLQPDSMGSYSKFTTRYADGHLGDYGWEDDGESHPEELRDRLKVTSYRLTRSDVAAWLPPIDRTVRLCELDADARRLYSVQEQAAAPALLAALSGGDISGSHVQKMRQIANTTIGAKLETLIERAKYHTEGRGMKIVVWAIFHESLKAAHQALTDAFVEQGKNAVPVATMPIFLAGGWDDRAKRMKQIEQWQNTRGPAILCANSLSSGIGIDLADADTSIMTELAWVPADFLQVEGRTQDIHQGKALTPRIYEYLLAKGTIDEDMAIAMLRKIGSIEKVIGADSSIKALGDVLHAGGVVASENLALRSEEPDVVREALIRLRTRLFGGDMSDPDAMVQHQLAANIDEAYTDDEPTEEPPTE